MRVLVTGSEGFVGKHVAQALTARGDEVLGMDRETGYDLDDREATGWIVAHQPDRIVHLASSCSTPGSVNDPLGTFRDTVMTAVNVLEAARELGVPIHITSSVKARDGMTPYGAAKRMVETWALEYQAAYGTSTIIVRPGTIYGPGQEGSTESGWIAWFLQAKEYNLPVTINGNGTQIRDLLHVSDYVRLILTQIDSPETYSDHKPGKIWDVGGGVENAVKIKQIAAHLGLDYKLGPPRYGDAGIYIGINDVPGWKPEIKWQESGMFG